MVDGAGWGPADVVGRGRVVGVGVGGRAGGLKHMRHLQGDGGVLCSDRDHICG